LRISEDTSGTPRRLALGHIAGAHGIRGEVLITSYTETPDGIADYGPLQDEAGGRRFDITVVRVTPKGVIARIAGIADRTAAEALKGTRLYIERAELPEPEPDTYYHADLIGLRADLADGTPLGKIISVQNYGAGDLLEIRRAGRGDTVLVPFTLAVVPAVDIAEGRVVIAAIAGLLD